MSDNPFPGPQPYRAAQRTRFFREDAARKLANQVMACRVTTVHGPSGAGKSSLLQAAVLPALEESDRVRVVKIDGWPADVAPLARLMRAMTTEFGLESVPEDENPAEQFTKVVELSAQQADDQPILLYLDQFEQLFITNHADDEMKALLSSLASLLERRRDEDVHVILSLREDYLGRLGDWARARPELVLQKFRVGPLSVGEMVQAMCRTAKEGESSQEWNADEIRALMLEVRVPGQHATDAAEVQAAFGQIVCRALWEARAAGHMTEARGANAEAMMHRYLDATLEGLGAFQGRARELLEQHLIDDEGRRRLLTEQEVEAVLGSGANDVVAKLEQAAILHAEARQGKRYFELGHDWLAKKVLERRVNRTAKEKATRQRLKVIATIAVGAAVVMSVMLWWALEQRARADENAKEARRASMMAGVRELIARDERNVAALVLASVDAPERTRGWKQLGIDLMAAFEPQSTRKHERAVNGVAWSPDSKRVAAVMDNVAYIFRSDGRADMVALRAHGDNSFWYPSFSPDGQRVVMVSGNDAYVFPADGCGEPVVLHGHEDYVLAAVWSSDSKRVMTASEDRTVRIWHADGQGDVVTLCCHQSRVIALRFSPNGREVLTASFDNTVRIWSSDGQEEPLVLQAPHNTVDVAGFSPGGERVLTASADGRAWLWRTDDQTNPVILEGHTNALTLASFNRLGTRILTTSADGTARLWRTDGQLEAALDGDKSGIFDASVSPDGKRVLTVSSRGSARIWRTDGKGEAVVVGHKSDVTAASFSPDGQQVVTGHGSHTQIWRADGQGAVVVLQHMTTESFHPDGEHIVTGSYGDGTVRIKRVDGVGNEVVLHAPKRVMKTSFSPDGQWVVAVLSDNTAQIWRADGTGEPVVLRGHENYIRTVCFSPDDKRVVTTSSDGTARIWHTEAQVEAVVLREQTSKITLASFSPDGQRVLTASSDGTVRIWWAYGNGESVVVHKYKGDVTAAFSPNGQQVVAASLDGTAHIWRADGKGDAVALKGYGGGAKTASFSPNGEYLMIGAGAEVLIWSANDTVGNPIVLKGHKGWIQSAEWSPDSTHIVTASGDTTARIWAADGSSEPVVLKGNDDTVEAVAWTSAGTRILTTSGDRTTRIWPISIPLLQQALRNATTDCLTPLQRQTYLLESESDARTRYEQCERSYDRTPSANP